MKLWAFLIYFSFLITVIVSQTLTTSSGPLAKSALLKSSISADQNLKPKILNCESNVTVKEEQDRGTYVTQIQATDDDPPENGGTITYKIIKRDGERTYFTIDNITGIIKTNTQFDRDEPTRQKEMYLTVQASDNGSPPLSDICTIKIFIEDINDNPPSFDSSEYSSRVPEDAKDGQIVARVLAYDIDDGENGRLTYGFGDTNSDFSKFFRIDENTGVVYLKTSVAHLKDNKLKNIVTVVDNGANPSRSTADISITIVGSDKRAPMISNSNNDIPLKLNESFVEFGKQLFTIAAESNMQDEKEVIFELVKGKTAQTNIDQTFVLTPSNETHAFITLGRPLDYEKVTDYILTVRVKNKDQMEATSNFYIEVLDVNDEIPTFIDILKGSVIENEEAGQLAMQVRAVDKDGTTANNIVKYRLETHTDEFEIDEDSGIIKSKQKFDREQVSLYHVKVKAYDNSPSALVQTGEPNFVYQQFQITIEDRNDNEPKFKKPAYVFENILETSDIGKVVGEVVAEDKDTASVIKYSIMSGNDDNAFSIEETTGTIKVAAKLDFEKKENYTLNIKAFDGIYEDTAEVFITIYNENDELPIFYEPKDTIIELEEEKIEVGCLVHVKAYDPDIKDRNADQHIIYELQKEVRPFLDIDNNGCVSLKQKLDRDKPNGSPTRQVYVYALDNNGGPDSHRNQIELEIRLTDINDNAPFLNVTEIVWYENQDPGDISELTADDFDSPENGPPFKFSISPSASDDIFQKFKIRDQKILLALVSFDREQQKYYDIPIEIKDSGKEPMSGISILRVIIGDKNDNPAMDGSSEIFVYKYEKLNIDIVIGRVFVEDKDDWDVVDKKFVQLSDDSNFYLKDYGMIAMRSTTSSGVYTLHYDVTEENLPEISAHTVKANVTVEVKELIEEAVWKSGSLRLNGTTIENFIEKDGIVKSSKKDRLQEHISRVLNTSLTNVDVFTVLQSPSDPSLVDVRFSAHGSPYYYPEKLNNIAADHQDALEKELKVKFVMISINECLNDTVCSESCSNILNIKNEPAVVFTNKTSFVGIQAVVEAECTCQKKQTLACYNGGTPIEDSVCTCPPGFAGPHCETLSIGFTGNGWAMYPTFDPCNQTEIVLHVQPQTDSGLVFYIGPLNERQIFLTRDFMSLELEDGHPLLKLNVGKNTIKVLSKKLISDGAQHKIKIHFSTVDITMEIDDCKSECYQLVEIRPPGLLNVNGPLQLGGTKFPLNSEVVKSYWDNTIPTGNKFSGCISNFTYNGFLYNLGAPSDQYQSFTDCNYGVTQAVTLGRDSLVAILVCLAILIILMLALVVYRKKQDKMHDKEIDDTRENIINYDDEGGGECDTNYDLRVLQPTMDEKPPLINNDIPADIRVFLNTKKGSCDKDPESLPFDDVRHYAYEGDGNSTGSLSSLASCTDDGDLNFSHISSFGPRFRKLADIYGEDSNDEESENGEESWC